MRAFFRDCFCGLGLGLEGAGLGLGLGIETLLHCCLSPEVKNVGCKSRSQINRPNFVYWEPYSKIAKVSVTDLVAVFFCILID